MSNVTPTGPTIDRRGFLSIIGICTAIGTMSGCVGSLKNSSDMRKMKNNANYLDTKISEAYNF